MWELRPCGASRNRSSIWRPTSSFSSLGAIFSVPPKRQRASPGAISQDPQRCLVGGHPSCLEGLLDFWCWLLVLKTYLPRIWPPKVPTQAGLLGWAWHLVVLVPHTGSCQNYGPFLGTLNNRCRTIIGTQKGTLILTTTHMRHFTRSWWRSAKFPKP